jgi:hypothetical protein
MLLEGSLIFIKVVSGSNALAPIRNWNPIPRGCHPATAGGRAHEAEVLVWCQISQTI